MTDYIARRSCAGLVSSATTNSHSSRTATSGEAGAQTTRAAILGANRPAWDAIDAFRRTRGAIKHAGEPVELTARSSQSVLAFPAPTAGSLIPVCVPALPTYIWTRHVREESRKFSTGADAIECSSQRTDLTHRCAGS